MDDMQNRAEPFLSRVDELLLHRGRVLVAIDGRCAAGKTTLAEQIHEQRGYTVLHMDDFFLRPAQRTEQRLSEPGGNVDYERFEAEVLVPLQTGGDFTFRPYSCRTQSLADPVHVQPTPVVIVEGSYACHPRLRDRYDLRVFLTVEPAEQARRILRRNGSEMAARFRDLWIPLEESYFSACGVESACDLILHSAPEGGIF